MRTENLAIAFVDIVGFTPRTSAQSREENERMLRRFEETVRPVAGVFGGKIVKSIGDAFLVTFRSPTDALHCGMALHDRLAESQQSLPPAERFEIRVAVNVGEVRIEGSDVFGEAVNIAARIEGEAGAGEVWFSEAVYLVMTKSEVPFQEVGVRELKGIQDPVKLFRIPRVSEVGSYRVQGSGEPPAPADHPLAAPALPYGGAALAKVRERLAADPMLKAKDAISRSMAAAAPLAAGVTSRLRDSKAFRLAVGGVLLAVVVVAVVVAAWPEKKPQTPWEKFKQDVRRTLK